MHVRFCGNRILESSGLRFPKGAHNAQRNLAGILAHSHQTFIRRRTGEIRETYGKERKHRAHDFFLTVLIGLPPTWAPSSRSEET